MVLCLEPLFELQNQAGVQYLKNETSVLAQLANSVQRARQSSAVQWGVQPGLNESRVINLTVFGVSFKMHFFFLFFCRFLGWDTILKSMMV